MEELINAWLQGSYFTKFMTVFWLAAPLVIGLFFWFKEAGRGNEKMELKDEITQGNAYTEHFHGTLVEDPFRYMENPKDPHLVEWVEKQNQQTQQYLTDFQKRDNIKERLTQLWDYTSLSTPIEVAGKYFYVKKDGLKNQPVLYMQDGLEGEAVVVLDPNELSEEGTIALSSYNVSKNAKFLAYTLSESGSDWQNICVKNLENMEDTADEINYCKFTSTPWLGDEGFYYVRFPQPGSVPREDESNYQKVYFHKLGTHQSEDKIIYERPDFKELGFRPIISDDEKYLCLNVWIGTDSKNRFYYKSLKNEGNFIRLLDEHDAGYYFIGNDKSLFYFQTDLDAPKGRVIAIDVDKSFEEVEVIKECEESVLADVKIINNYLVAVYRQNAYYTIKVYNKIGQQITEIELPGLGSVGEIWGRSNGVELFYTFTSFLYPTTVFRYDFETGESKVFAAQEVNFDPELFETNQVFYISKDGTEVSMFITHKKDMELNGDNPTLLYGYGGFNVSVNPIYSPTTIMFLEEGGVYAVANLRGGSEYGEDWHRAGMLENKQNVFDDFISAGEWLIENQYTKSKKLAIMGRSNGGLLVAACMLQRPDLFGAVLCGVPVTDMLRYHRFTVGRYWIGEYGDPQNPEHFKFLYAYSPLHNVKQGVEYPPTLITTADSDDRVVPAHAFKFGATLQQKQGGNNPILVRVDTKAGHGHGKPTSMIIDEQTDIYSFIFKVFE